VSDIAATMPRNALQSLQPGSFSIIIGRDLARLLRVRVGEKIAVIVPTGNVTPAGFIPRMKQMTVTAIFSSGHYEYDSTMALTSVEDAAALYRTGGPTGIRVRIADMQQARDVSEQLARNLQPGWYATDWTEQNKTWFAAVQVEKRMMAIILFLIVLVGAFGLVSTLVMTVTEKRSDIAILRTLGATPRSIMAIFMIQGGIVGLVGVAIGVALGLAIACNLSVIVPAIESVLGVQFLPREIYFISQMPSDPRASDIIPIALFSLVMSLLATIYPSWRAAKINPAEALRYE
jgi:lipoprotein-releasing system permease protein